MKFAVTAFAIVSIGVAVVWQAILVSSSDKKSSGGLLVRLRRLLPQAPSSSQCDGLPATPLRMGILGASAIAQHAVVTPASYMASYLDPCSVQVAGIAARDPNRATQYAKKHSIIKAYQSYDELLQSDDIDAVYVGIPTLFHHKYALAAIRAGKHVLLEKPATVSAAEALELTTEAENEGVVLVEAFHYRFHPLWQRIGDIVRGGDIGDVAGFDVLIVMPSPKAVLESSWIGRYLGDGKIRSTSDHEHRKMLDRWSYGLDAILSLAGSSVDIKVDHASLNASVANIALRIQSHGTSTGSTAAAAAIPANIYATKEQLGLCWDLKVKGSRGEVQVTNFWFPSIYHSLKVIRNDEQGVITTEEQSHYGVGKDHGITTFEHQLRHFVRLCQQNTSTDEGSKKTSTANMIDNMKAVDAILNQAGIHDLTLSHES